MTNAQQEGAKRRRERIEAARARGTHTREEWEALKVACDYTCKKCGKREPEIKLTRDHIIPVTEPDCTDAITNIQPLCLRCNMRRGFDTLPEKQPNPFAKFGALMGRRGGPARAKALTAERRAEISRLGGQTTAERRRELLGLKARSRGRTK